MGEWGIDWDKPGAAERFGAVMEARRQGELAQEFKPLRRGWCLECRRFEPRCWNISRARRANGITAQRLHMGTHARHAGRKWRTSDPGLLPGGDIAGMAIFASKSTVQAASGSTTWRSRGSQITRCTLSLPAVRPASPTASFLRRQSRQFAPNGAASTTAHTVRCNRQ